MAHLFKVMYGAFDLENIDVNYVYKHSIYMYARKQHYRIR